MTLTNRKAKRQRCKARRRERLAARSWRWSWADEPAPDCHPSGLSWADADRLGPAGVAVVMCEQALVLDGLALELAE